MRDCWNAKADREGATSFAPAGSSRKRTDRNEADEDEGVEITQRRLKNKAILVVGSGSGIGAPGFTVTPEKADYLSKEGNETMSSSSKFPGKVVIVTGGSQGVGLGISQAFLKTGAAVVSCARKPFDGCPAATSDDERARSMHVQADIRDEAQIDRVIAETLARFGRLDVLVNNAGGQPPADLVTASPRFVRAIIDLNLTAPMLFAARAYRVMVEQESGGNIINISSQASMPGNGGASLTPYGAAKAGLNHMTRSLAVAWGKKVRVNCVSLGWVETEAMADLLLPENKEQWTATTSRIPVGRMGTPAEIGGICTFLASDAAAYINGTTIWADGGGI